MDLPRVHRQRLPQFCRGAGSRECGRRLHIGVYVRAVWARWECTSKGHEGQATHDGYNARVVLKPTFRTNQDLSTIAKHLYQGTVHHR